MAQYLPLLVMFVLAGVFAGVSFFASGLLAPRRPTAAKEAPYECGIVPDREPPERFPVRFYLVAMIFIIFDIEIIFLYPWAVIFRQLGGLRAVGDGGVRGRGVRLVRLPDRQRRPRLGPGQAHRVDARPRRVRRGRTTDIDGPPGRARRAGARPRSRWASSSSTTTSSPGGGGPREVGPAQQRLARHLRARLLRHRDDGHRRRPLRPEPLRHGGLPGLAPSGRPHDRGRPGAARRWRPSCARSTTR